LDIEFPVEFIVHGTPVSFQAKRQSSRDEWMARVRNACAAHLPYPHLVTSRPIAATMYYFPDGPMQGDIDNIIKLTLDALSRFVYIDDIQVERVVAQKFEPSRLFAFTAPSATLASVIEASRPALYIRLSDDPFEDLK
jgi:hypothetical protein